MSDSLEIVVVGAGVVGCAVAWELARAGHQVVVLEKNPGVTQGENQSSRNSGVIHAGLYYDQNTRPLKARLCVQGNRLLYRFCREQGVPALRCGKLVVAVNEPEVSVLETYYRRARENGVPVELMDGGRAREREPNLRARAALFLPSSGIIDATALVYRLHVLAGIQGAHFQVETELASVRDRPEGLELGLRYRDGAGDRVLCRHLVNCAGLEFDTVARLVDASSPYVCDPVRGEAMKFYRTRRPELALKGTNIYPTPRRITTARGSYFTVGVHLTPTLESDAQGRVDFGPVVTVGPLNRQARHRQDYGGDFRPVEEFLEMVGEFFPGLRPGDLEPHQAGIQARMAGHQDWRVEFSPAQPRCLNFLGIDSPGLTGSLALARLAREMLFP